MDLNDSQLNIVKNANGKSLIIAGPGSGKTRTLIYRVAELIKSGVNPANILLLTFTNKAANEMTQRVQRITGLEKLGITSGTFHYFANRILRRHADFMGFTENFTILDEQDSLQVLTAICESIGGKELSKKARKIREKIGLKVLQMKEFSDFSKEPEKLEDIYGRYLKKCRELNAMDFNHLLFNLHQLLVKNNQAREYYQMKFQHVLVDEFQDTDKLQNEIINILAKGNNLLVVGDDCQSIYSFRGTDIKNILEFPNKHKDCKIFKLEDNYRSTKKIVEMINHSIKNNSHAFEKRLRTVLEDGEKPIVYGALNTNDEARFVVAKIKELMKTSSLSEIGVLFRATSHCSNLEMELAKEKIPYVLRGGLKFFEKKHIKDILAFLKIHANKKDEIAWRRVLLLFEGIGRTTTEKIILDPSMIEQKKLGKKANESMEVLEKALTFESNPTDALKQVDMIFYHKYLEENFDDYKERREEIGVLIELSKNYRNIKSFVNDITLNRDDMKERGESTQRLVLSTIHQAKGLEWDNVFVIGLAQGQFPMIRNDTDLEEERRLFYVAISRAKKGLVLSYPMTSERSFYSFGQDNIPSLFIEELPKECYDFI
ncbi:MAG: ATP-dependent helicase [Candidatus Micrarchaeota archaeon]